MTLSLSPKNTKIILIGNSVYDHPESFANVPPIQNNLRALSHLFHDPRVFGAYQHNIFTLHNEGDETIYRSIADLCDDTSIENLIVYYAGHSYIAPDGRFYLTARNSEVRLIEQNGLRFDQLLKRIQTSKAQHKLFILDTCNSGRATESVNARLFPHSAKEKTYVLASSPRHQRSYFNPTAKYTYFTGALMQVLRQGMAGQASGLEIQQVQRSVKEILQQASLPEPRLVSNTRSKFYCFKNQQASPVEEVPFDPNEREATIEPLSAGSKPATNVGPLFFFMAVAILFGMLLHGWWPF